ncbi:lysozyme family protein [Marinobacterium weihaiense]|uniref:Lysozyme n=1 Tax=Marinobacterium weihaiense TaxID=2851016 RepID=A0ABS6MAL8_9GAMM|nr:hypothetical protein [Marinobacterium weihaiense]MBV0933333.1 hypothetical protein [Marinobacterium weihaiense]
MHPPLPFIDQLLLQLEQQEGRIAHMYRDTRGFITIGVGHLLTSEHDALALPLVHRDSGLPASADTIRAEYRKLATRPYGQRYGASSFAAHTRLDLPDPEIDNLTQRHIAGFHQELGGLYGRAHFSAMPERVQLALFDMIFNLGLPKLQHGFPRFNRHIRNGDWPAAARESHRRGISEARNQHVQDLLSG